MAASKLQQQVTQTLAEVFNLLQQASFDGLKPGQMRTVTRTIDTYQEVVKGFAEETLLVSEPVVAEVPSETV